MKFVRTSHLLAFFALGVVSCGDTPGDALSGQRSVTELEAHLLEQEAIADCMAQRGFEYYLLPFVPSAQSTFDEAILLEAPETEAYSATKFLLQGRFLPTGAPPEEFDPAEVAAYDRALIGVHGDHSHDGEVDHAHTEGSDGCREQGLDARPDASEVEDLQDWQGPGAVALVDEYYERLSASNEFEEFRSSWSACMAEAGFEGESPLTHWQSVLERQQERLDLFLEEESMAEEAIERYVESSDGLVVLDEEWIDGLVAQVPGLSPLFEAEVEEAKADSACRQEYATLIAEVLDDLDDEIFG